MSPERNENEMAPSVESEGMTGSTVEEGPLIPHRRQESFDEAVPQDVPRFYDQTQLRRVKAIVHRARETEKLPRFWFTGPTGCGKTTAAQRLAQELDAPVFTVQGLYDIRETDLLGSPTILDGTVYWQDGPVTRALRASKQRQTVLLFDEINRARPEAKGVLFPILDGRARVHTGRGSEVIEADPYNLIVVVTTNEGPEYFTEQLDLAEQRRYGSKFEMGYIGLENFEAGADLVTSRTPVSDPLARAMLTAVNDTRRIARDSESALQKGIPTSLVLEWARSAHIYASDGIDDPIMSAARDTVTRPFYGDNPDAMSTVVTTLRSRVGGAPVPEEQFLDWLASKIDADEDSKFVNNVFASDVVDREQFSQG